MVGLGGGLIKAAVCCNTDTAFLSRFLTVRAHVESLDARDCKSKSFYKSKLS